MQEMPKALENASHLKHKIYLLTKENKGTAMDYISPQSLRPAYSIG